MNGTVYIHSNKDTGKVYVGPLSDDTKRKLSESLKGRKHSEESKQKMRDARKANPTGFYANLVSQKEKQTNL
jgi:hypothetical protein